MSDTRNFVTCFEKPINTQTSTDTDDFLNEYLSTLDKILEEDDEYTTIVNTNYKGAKHE